MPSIARLTSTRPAFNAPFAEQVSFFKKKLNLPTERWDNIVHGAHDKAFVVAGAQAADLLYDLNAAVGKAIEQGTGLQAFRKDFKTLVAKHGWTGFTGSDSKAGLAWRTKVIYQTNMATSYAAGRFQQLSDPELLKALPYWTYKHSDSSVTPRPLHVSWDGLTLPPDHYFWKTHFPPNGWGCNCRAIAASKAAFMQAVAKGRGPADAPAAGDINGIDPGFAYAPGAAADTSYRQLVQDKLIKYPPAITKALTRDVNRYLNASEPAPDFVHRVLADKSVKESLWLGFVENPEAINDLVDQDVTGYTVTLPADVPRHVERNHGNDGGDQRPPVPDDYSSLIDVLNSPDRIVRGHDGDSLEKLQRVIATKEIEGETHRAVFEVRPGKNTRTLSLVTLVVKSV
jgi:hypothetical protein